MIQIQVGAEFLDLETIDSIPITFQANDPTKIDSFQSNFSINVKIPATSVNRRILGFVDSYNTSSQSAYTFLDCLVIDFGAIILPKAKLRVGKITKQKYIAEIEIQIFSGNINFFESISNKTLQNLNLSIYDHEMLFGISDSQANTFLDGYIYDVYSRGTYVDALKGLYSYFFPSIFCLTIFEKIVSEAGLSLVFANGTPTSPVDFAKMLLPHVGGVRTCINEIAKKHSGKITTGYNKIANGGGFDTFTTLQFANIEHSLGTKFFDVPPFNTPQSDFEPNPYSGSTYVLPNSSEGKYVCNEDFLFVLLSYYFPIGAVPTLVQLRDDSVLNIVNITAGALTLIEVASGTAIIENSFITISGVVGTMGAVLNTNTYQVGSVVFGATNIVTITVNTTALTYVSGGVLDNIIVRKFENDFSDGVYTYMSQNQYVIVDTNSNVWEFSTYLQNPFFFEVKVVDNEAVRIKKWEVSANLPPIQQRDFFKFFAIYYGLFPTYNPFTSELILTPFDNILSLQNAVDWSEKVDYSKARETNFEFGDYAKNNYFEYRNIQQGNLQFESESAELEKVVYTAPFELLLDNTFFGNFTEVLSLIQFEDTTLLQQNPSLKKYKFTKKVQPLTFLEGQSNLDLSVAVYQIPFNPTTDYLIYATNVAISSTERLNFQDAIDFNYNAIKALLKDARQEIVYINLSVLDIQKLDFSKPIWIGNDYNAYFYLAKVVQYKNNSQSVRCELFRISL